MEGCTDLATRQPRPNLPYIKDRSGVAVVIHLRPSNDLDLASVQIEKPVKARTVL